MHGNTSHENREIPGPPARQAGDGTQREVGRRTPLMHEPALPQNFVDPGGGVCLKSKVAAWSAMGMKLGR
jgi:hypothetical protein